MNAARLAAISVMVAVLSGCGGGTRQPAGQTPPSSRDIHRTFAVTGGEACVFSAPSTAFGLVGHVAWGFELTSGIWEFGANEGPEYWPPRKADISKTWDETGSFSVMLAAFAEGGPYEGTSYYTSYKCRAVSMPDTAGAAAEVSHESHQYYVIPSQDCLSQVYNVLNVYGVTGLPNATGVFDFVPNRWYERLPGFSAQGRL